MEKRILPTQMHITKCISQKFRQKLQKIEKRVGRIRLKNATIKKVEFINDIKKAINNKIDYAFLFCKNISLSGFPKFSSREEIPEGENVIAIGHPLGYDFTVTRGIISASKRLINDINYIQTDVPFTIVGRISDNAKVKASPYNDFFFNNDNDFSEYYQNNIALFDLNKLNDINNRINTFYLSDSKYNIESTPKSRIYIKKMFK